MLIEQILIQLADEHTILARNQYQSKQKEVNEVNNTPLQHIDLSVFIDIIFSRNVQSVFSLDLF